VSEARSAICLVIDRLSAAYVGALGNTWIHTPAFDRLAAQSIVFDRAMIDSPSLDAVYESFGAGNAAGRNSASTTEASRERWLPELCRAHGIPTLLLTDNDNVAAHRVASAFDEVVHLSQPQLHEQGVHRMSNAPITSSDWQETQLAAFFAAAVETLKTRRAPGLVWLHTGALARIWDSPQALRDQYAAEDDPPAPSIVQPPSFMLDEQTDPDMLLGLRHAYAGEVSVLDHCLGMLLDTIDAGNWQSALLGVTSCRGYPLGEHGVIGDAREALYGELLRTPLCLRVPGGPRFGAHSQALAQPADLYATIVDWLAPSGSAEKAGVRKSDNGRSLLHVERMTDSLRAMAIARSKSGEIALATPAWFVRAPTPREGELAGEAQAKTPVPERRIELYSQPDDYFEVNEVSDRCQEIIEEFREVVQGVESANGQIGSEEFSLSEAALGVR
jgi:arylsulfatase A-like enzyme